ncbi:hypothetical protein F4774DRAFT_415984 [Daldinia eschscholtzii]|nr:hypothetical protein F4774DRAFT_415984 [Daldinia eschscholtzii]
MSNRVLKSSAKRKSHANQRESKELRASYIELTGVAVVPCSNCARFEESSCVFTSGLSSYNVCTRKSQRVGCDVLEMNTLNNLTREIKSLKDERHKIEDELSRCQEEISRLSRCQEEMSRLVARLKEVRLKEEGAKAVALRILQREEELDRLEEEEANVGQDVPSEAGPSTAPDSSSIDPGGAALFWDDFDLNLDSMGGQDFPGETPQQAPERFQGS